jgi:FlaA1/EpsC-like NDP-sugar epimerase
MNKRINGLAKRAFLAFIDLALFFAINVSVCYLCYDGKIFGVPYSSILFNHIHLLITSAAIFVINHIFGLYKAVWTYASPSEYINCFVASIADTALLYITDKVLYKTILGYSEIMPFYYYALVLILVSFATLAPRMGYRVLRHEIKKYLTPTGPNQKRVMIVGAGYMGSAIIEDMHSNQYSKKRPVVAVDDNPAKKGKRISGVRIAGNCEDIPELAEKYSIDEIVICIPSATKTRLNEIVKICLDTGIKVKTSPSLEEILEEDFNSKKIRDVDIADLLSREEITLDVKACKYLIDSVILVTGGGGSIGSELCKQCARYTPNTIVIFDIYENSAFELENELKKKYGDTINIKVRIGSVRDMKRLEEVFEEFRPDVVFHAAAHKHVPLMEDSPCEAVKNNIFGTYNVAVAADKYNVSKMVVLSTDKAVNPTNVMGATKRFTEIIVQYMDKKSTSTRYTAVRFGNVLGSHGSVIPIFRKQIEEGGPVTVTHPDISRYFMTIPEAAQLVCQAGGLAQGGEVFVLDMGEPVKIMDLAENLIKLSGYTVEEIGIEITGLRPGEKLYEELSTDSELKTRKRTANSKIFVNQPTDIDDESFEKAMKSFENITEENVKSVLQEAVPNYDSAARDRYYEEELQ